MQIALVISILSVLVALTPKTNAIRTPKDCTTMYKIIKSSKFAPSFALYEMSTWNRGIDCCAGSWRNIVQCNDRNNIISL